MSESQRIYLDYAASTPVLPEVIDAMEPFWREIYGNSNALHAEGRGARKAVESAREYIAESVGAGSNELMFTSGGTEANSMAIRGGIEALQEGGVSVSDMQLVTSVIEHPSVKDVFSYYEKKGAQVVYLPVGDDGIVDLDAAEELVTEHVAFMSLMFANNEIGTLQPVVEVAQLVKRKNKDALVHTDASQAPLFYELNVSVLGVDLLTLDAQKLYGPKGVGALYVRKNTPISPLFIGGKQEKGVRPGTPNVPGIVGFHSAYKIADERREKARADVRAVRDYFLTILQEALPQSVVNGDLEKRLPNNLNVSFPDTESELLVLQLDKRGIACSAKSACLADGGEGSYVVGAIDPERARGAVRFSLGVETRKEEVETVVSVLTDLLKA